MRQPALSLILFSTMALLGETAQSQTHPEGTGLVNYAGYADCILLENENTPFRNTLTSGSGNGRPKSPALDAPG